MNDTHMHKPMKGHAQFVAAKWYTSHMMTLNQKRFPKQGSSQLPITPEEYEGSVRELMSTKRLRDMAPRWLNSAVNHISQPIPGEERSIIKKGWDQMYLEPIAQEGFLEVACRAGRDYGGAAQATESTDTSRADSMDGTTREH